MLDVCEATLARPDFTDVHQTNIDGRTALEMATQLGLQEICDVIQASEQFRSSPS